MTPETIIETARGAIMALKGGGTTGPYALIIPLGYALFKDEILAALRPDGVLKVTDGKGKGVQVLAYDPDSDQDRLPSNRV